MPIAAASPDTKPLVARLKSSPIFSNDARISLEIEVENASNMDLYVLTWATPLEGLSSDCLKVIRDQREVVEYDGPMFKRGEPTVDDYVELKAGQKVSKMFDLSGAYAVHVPGSYEIALDTVIHSVLPQLPGLSNAMQAKRLTDTDQPLLGGATRFIVSGPLGGDRPKTEGEEARDQDRSMFKTEGEEATGLAQRLRTLSAEPWRSKRR